MRPILALFGLVGICIILLDAFESMVLPRRVTRRYRYTRLFYRATWTVWRLLALAISAGKWREAFLSRFGPLSLLALITTWVFALIVAFALLEWALATALRTGGGELDFSSYVYLSGVTFFPLGYGDVTPATTLGRALSVIEAGLGFGFLAVVIGYLPGISQAFSQREVTISLLDARAGSPPNASQALLRAARSGCLTGVDGFLREWERWSAELLESHLSFPVLSYYRSQHENQSWLAALTVILDTSAFLTVAVRGRNTYQAQLTFAMARHAAVDLGLVFKVRPQLPESDRLPPARFAAFRDHLRAADLEVNESPETEERLREVRGMYEPFVNALASYFMLILPPFVPERPEADNWQRSAWMPRAPGIGNFPNGPAGGDHFA